MNKSRIMLIALSVFLASCANRYPSVNLYESKMDSQKETTTKILDESIILASRVLLKDKTQKFELNENSGTIKIDSVSYYKSFSIEGSKGNKFSLEVKSFVSSGEEWYVAVPKLHLVSSNSNVILDEPSSISGHLPAVGPYRMTGKWEGVFPEDGKYYVIVTTDTRFLNKKVDKESGFLYAPGVMGLLNWDLYGHFMGEMEITLD